MRTLHSSGNLSPALDRREDRRRSRRVRGGLLLLGVLASLPLFLPGISLLAFLLFSPGFAWLFHCIEIRRPLRKVYADGVFYIWGHFIGAYHWFWAMYPLDFVGLDGIGSLAVILAASVLLPLVLALPFALCFLSTAAAARAPFVCRHKLLFPVLLGAGWVICSFLQTTYALNIPFADLAVSQGRNLTVLASASLLGHYFTDFLIVVVNGLLAWSVLWLWQHREDWREDLPRLRRSLLPVLLALCVFLGNLETGAVLRALPKEEQQPICAAVIQGNISSREQWSGEGRLDAAMQTYRRLTLAAAEEGAQLVLWPETIINVAIYNGSYYYKQLQALAKEADVTLLVGSIGRETGLAEGKLNALYLFRPDGTGSDTVYIKHHLVPFGEFLPARDFFTVAFPALAQLSTLVQDLQVGTEPAVFFEELANMGGMICFDSIYSDVARDATLAGAELLLLPTNDSWFGLSLATEMHTSHAVLRAVENGRPVLRAGATGISAFISADGEVLQSLPAGEEGYLIGQITPTTSTTLYTRVGDVVVPICAAMVAAPLLAWGVLHLIKSLQQKERMSPWNCKNKKP